MIQVAKPTGHREHPVPMLTSCWSKTTVTLCSTTHRRAQPHGLPGKVATRAGRCTQEKTSSRRMAILRQILTCDPVIAGIYWSSRVNGNVVPPTVQVATSGSAPVSQLRRAPRRLSLSSVTKTEILSLMIQVAKPTGHREHPVPMLTSCWSDNDGNTVLYNTSKSAAPHWSTGTAGRT